MTLIVGDRIREVLPLLVSSKYKFDQKTAFSNGVQYCNLAFYAAIGVGFRGGNGSRRLGPIVTVTPIVNRISVDKNGDDEPLILVDSRRNGSQ